ncbi:beta-galactosidase [Saccharibacillus sp. CPCC 101409]|uniref:beta-galactosidase n=1 Tax=Saccharibacillus sp. CPCC 101409 TaxID=3058041 RepID=UPI0026732F3C|nr:beta-galactosidase [Saccharibacillus sp. CPCC 101409]MDO3412314.1 beta-galactosidase [Saccharibacillus sp. CPCC 101409]
MPTFEAKGNRFIYNDENIQLRSGAIHYFRVVPEYWEDRLRRLIACGFNTVETYVAWNVHEPEEGRFVFDGIADVEAFVRLAGSLGLHVIVRPSPYICAEWEFGGLPAWLLENGDMRLRCSDPAYLEKVDAYFDELLPRLRPLLCTNGGPVIAMQVENEYGSYGSDTSYLEYLRDGMIRRGMDVLLFTSDGPEISLLRAGSVEGTLATVNFGSGTPGAFEKLRRHQPEGPMMVMEFWDGWFDQWMGPHHTRPASEIAAELEQILDLDASFNFYMFHGGTNFGLMNGANHVKNYEPTVSSYDYSALLTENGEPSEAYFAVRELLKNRLGLTPPEPPAPLPKQAYGRVELSESAVLFDQLDRLAGAPIGTICPEPMERVGQSYGFILYTTRVGAEHDGGELFIQEVRDRALVFANGEQIGLVGRWEPQRGLRLSIPEGGIRLDILVENMGRINYGPLMRDRKGITEGVRIGNQFLHGWEIVPLPLDDLSPLKFAPGEADRHGGSGAPLETAAEPLIEQVGGWEGEGGATAEGPALAAPGSGEAAIVTSAQDSAAEAGEAGLPLAEQVGGWEGEGGATVEGPALAAPGSGEAAIVPSAEDGAAEARAAGLPAQSGEDAGSRPAFHRGTFAVDGEPADTFLRTDGWRKGVAWINGFMLGRYWQAGPTRTLYVPAPLLREGENEIVVFELHGFGGDAAPLVELTDRPDLG